MEVNKEEALRCLHIAQKHRNSGNHTTALKFARKSVALYSTPEGSAMVSIVEREMETGGSSSANGSPAPSNDDKGSSAKASGVEEHVTSAHARPGHGSSSGAKAKASSGGAAAEEKGKQRTYTSKQIEVVRRIKSYQHHQYYEILSVEKSCSENDVKRSYRKLALALHPDKNGAPGADEAFKMVSKAFQVLSDSNLRAAYDRNPSYDPTQRGGGGAASRSSGFGHPGFSNAGGFQGDINPEDLFNMFFGGGGMGGGQFGNANVFTFGGPGGFQAQFGGPRRRPGGAGAVPNEPASPLAALLPLLLLFAFAMISIIPSLFGGGEDPTPRWSFEPTNELNAHRNTWSKGIDYYVNQAQWENSHIFQSVPEQKRGLGNEGLHSAKVRQFDRNIETSYIRMLQSQCEYDKAHKQHEISQHTGFLGIGADYDKIRELRAQKSPACEQLHSWGLQQTRSQTF